jgi:transposase-like protein
LNPSVPYTEAEKRQIVAAYFERPSLLGIERIFGVARQTVGAWLKKSRPGTNPQSHAVARAGQG